MDLFPSLGVASSITVFGLIVLAVVTGVRRGWEVDPAGSRARALYLYAVCFVALVIAVFAIEGIISAIVHIILPSHAPSILGVATVGGPSDDQFTNEAVLGGLIAIAALLVFLFHYRRVEDALREPGWLHGPGARVRRGYIYLSSFVWILVALFAAVGAAFGLYEIIAPDTAGLGAPTDTVRDSGIASLVSLGLLALIAVVVFRTHWRRLAFARPAAPAVARPPDTAELPPPAVPPPAAPPPPPPHTPPPPPGTPPAE
jgi:hypothetical protein